MVNFFLFLFFKLITTKDGTFVSLGGIYSQQRQDMDRKLIIGYIVVHSKFPYKNKCVTGKQPICRQEYITNCICVMQSYSFAQNKNYIQGELYYTQSNKIWLF